MRQSLIGLPTVFNSQPSTPPSATAISISTRQFVNSYAPQHFTARGIEARFIISISASLRRYTAYQRKSTPQLLITSSANSNYYSQAAPLASSINNQWTAPISSTLIFSSLSNPSFINWLTSQLHSSINSLTLHRSSAASFIVLQQHTVNCHDQAVTLLPSDRYCKTGTAFSCSHHTVSCHHQTVAAISTAFNCQHQLSPSASRNSPKSSIQQGTPTTAILSRLPASSDPQPIVHQLIS